MKAIDELKMVLAISAEARDIERARVLGLFQSLAQQMDAKADEDDGYTGLVWTAAASSIRRVCQEATGE